MTLDEIFQLSGTRGVDIHEHYPTFQHEVISRKAQQVIEIGVGSGNSSSAFLIALRETNGRLWSVDIEPTEAALELKAACPDWTYIHGESLTVEPTAPFRADVLFIDSEHSYTQTYNELDAYAPHVKSGGIILLHDTETSFAEVKPAMIQWCLDNYYHWENDPKCYGLGKILIP